MPTKEYVVTVYKKDWLENLYVYMISLGCKLVLKRPDSRNTHYLLTEKQANNLRQNQNIWAVDAVDDFKVKKFEIEPEPYTVGGEFWKNGPGSTGVTPLMHQWGHIHCAGNDIQRRQGGEWGDPSLTEVITDGVEVYNNGRHTDVVIVDDPVSFDNEEWYSDTTASTRFVQYQWFNELNSLVSTIDDDGQTLPTGAIAYHDGASLALYHGNHVTGTACGRHYGWAREANIYNIALTDTWLSGQKIQSLLVWDYLRAFHKNKPINPETGKRNPTISNHSYGGIIEFETPLTIADVGFVSWRGVTYNPSNPPAGGWTEQSLTANFGIRFGVQDIPGYSSAVIADVQDAIADGIVVIGAAGNDNMYLAEEGDQDWDNIVEYFGSNRYQNRGSYPNSSDSGSIVVGALQDNNQFSRSTYSQHGPGVDVFAPGDGILSVYGNTGGFNDTKYNQGSGNYYYPIQGTSMASPQVCGIIAIAAGGGQDTFNQGDAKTYVDTISKYGSMTFNFGSGGHDDNTADMGAPNKFIIAESIRPEYGYIMRQKDARPGVGVNIGRNDYDEGVAFPRPRLRFAPKPKPVSSPQTYTFSVGNSGASHYTFTGSDRDNSFSNTNDPTINCNAGDTLVFNVSASGHPFYVKTSATTGTGNQVSTGTISGQGTVSAAVTWDTTGVTPGTYYYICQFHGGMVGQIIIS
jgi:plastocyanin